jgi:hypothetical protein
MNNCFFVYINTDENTTLEKGEKTFPFSSTMKEKKEKIKAIVSSHTHQHLSCSLFFVLTYFIYSNKDPKKKERNN